MKNNCSRHIETTAVVGGTQYVQQGKAFWEPARGSNKSNLTNPILSL